MQKVKPVVIVSRCLLGERTRYDGHPIHDDVVLSVLQKFEVRGFCPEVEIGLKVPREPIVLLKRKGKIVAVDEKEGTDLTAKLIRASEKFLERIESVHGFILKSKSPSCGIFDAKIVEPSSREVRGMGIFARKAKKFFPLVPMIDENGLRDKGRKMRFMLRVFSLTLVDKVIYDYWNNADISKLKGGFEKFFSAETGKVSTPSSHPRDEKEELKMRFATFISRAEVKSLQKLILFLTFPEIFD